MARWLTAVLLAIGLLLTGCSATEVTTSATTSAGTAAGAGPAQVGLPTSGLAPATATTGLVVVRVSALPPQAVLTLTLIATGGPFPYPRDGAVFGNQERGLPARPAGFYREYTVVTPGSPDRGARRIVAGQDGARFWTQDHYRSFQEVVAS